MQRIDHIRSLKATSNEILSDNTEMLASVGSNARFGVLNQFFAVMFFKTYTINQL